MAAGKEGATPDDIMGAAQIKPLLMLSKREPVSAAVGMTADKLGVVLLDKKAKPKKALAQLRGAAKKIQLGLDNASLRFGTAEVDPEINSSLVRFRINKEAPGPLGPKLREHLKKAGFTKVEFVVDPTLEEEKEEADERAAEPEAAAEADWAGLSAELMTLAKQIAGSAAGDAGRQATLVGLAGTANGTVKARQDYPGAQASVTALRKALEGGDTGAGSGKAMEIWQAAKDSVDDQLRELSDELRESAVPELVDVAGEVETLLEPLRVKLAVALLNYDQVRGPETRAKALQAVSAASEWLASEARVRAVDENPFEVTVTAAATLGAALRQLEGALGAA